MSTAFISKSKAAKAEKAALRKSIFIKGARSNNLKNIDLEIPKNQLVVVTGVSGSGKSSITMDTLYAEGQRRYVESLSSYARQFLGRMKKPDVDYIKGICPAIAIEQKVSTSNARSTVGTLTEVYDYLRLLYARIGRTYSPISGEQVKRHFTTDVVDFVQKQEEGAKVQLFMPLPIKYEDRSLEQELKLLLQKGFTRMFWEGEMNHIQDILESDEFDLSNTLNEYKSEDVRILIDRFVVKKEDEENQKRIADSIQTAFYESEGECLLTVDGGRWTVDGEQQGNGTAVSRPPSTVSRFNTRFELDGMEFLEQNPQLFNFNNPYGACPKCEGFSKVMGIAEQKVIPDPSKNVYEKAVVCWSGEKYGLCLDDFLKAAHHFDFPVHTPYQDLTKKQQRLLWTGNKHFNGINAFFEELEEKLYKIQNRVMLARYRGRTTCPVCNGGRLRPESTYVKIGGKAITDLIDMPIDELLEFFIELEKPKSKLPNPLTENERVIAKRLLLEASSRLRFMCEVGLKYLTLNRLSATLSGGETQRINLTRTLGSNLTASMYLLDEPSVGLHPRDTSQLVEVLKNLRDLGNTVVVVEHEEDVIKSADYLIDIGPAAGIHGGHVVFAGPYKNIYKDASDSLTTKYMSGKMQIEVPKMRRKAVKWIEVKGARQHNLKNIDVKIPLNCLTVVSGVSGSGKTTLVKDILHPVLKAHFGEPTSKTPGQHKALTGDLNSLTQIEMVNQKPIGRSSRSNPVTYVKAYDNIRNLMSGQQLSRIRGYKPGYFSFNVDGGRCDACQGEGEQIIEMQFLADVRLECEDCHGKRFKPEMLDVKYNGKDIHEILDLTIEEALDFFADQKDIVKKIHPLFDVGLGYVKLGQSSSTLSGGEAQRVKLASFLNKERKGQNTSYLFLMNRPLACISTTSASCWMH